ncbi:hypothetical protein Hanom_Chr15g01382381 [Helianthus anomalus]
MRGLKVGKNSLKINLERFAKENGPVDTGGFQSGFDAKSVRKDERVSMNRFESFTIPGCSCSMALKDHKVEKAEVEEIRVKAEVSALGSRHDKAVWQELEICPR